MILGCLSRHNRDLEWRTLKPSRCVTGLRSWIDHVIAVRSRMDHVIALRQISVTALFYLEDSRKIHLRGLRARGSKVRRRPPPRRGERASRLWLLDSHVSLSLGLSFVNWATQECCLFHLRSSLRSSDLLLFCIRGLFPSLSFSHRHFGLLFPILPTWQYLTLLLAWRIPRREEPGGLQSMGSQRVGHDSLTNTQHTTVLTEFKMSVCRFSLQK